MPVSRGRDGAGAVLGAALVCEWRRAFAPCGARTPACPLRSIGWRNGPGACEGRRNAARTLDLDIVAIGGLIRPAPDPVLPHPRAHLRAFVLCPLRDVAPDWIHPALGCSVRAMLASAAPQQIRVI